MNQVLTTVEYADRFQTANRINECNVSKWLLSESSQLARIIQVVPVEQVLGRSQNK